MMDDGLFFGDALLHRWKLEGGLMVFGSAESWAHVDLSDESVHLLLLRLGGSQREGAVDDSRCYGQDEIPTTAIFNELPDGLDGQLRAPLAGSVAREQRPPGAPRTARRPKGEVGGRDPKRRCERSSPAASR